MTHKIKLVYVHAHLPLGGVENHMLQLCRHLDRDRFEIEVCLYEKGGPMLPLFEEIDIPVEIIPVLDSKRRISEKRFQEFVKKLRGFEIFHSYYGGGQLHVGFQAAFVAKVPVQVQSVEWPVPAAGEHIDAAILETDFVLRIQEKAGVKCPLVRINPGIDLSRFDPRSVRPAVQFDGPVVGRVSRLVPEKDPESFVRSAALVQKLHPEANFLIVGDGPLRHQLESLAGQLNANIRFYGETMDVPGVLAAMDIFAYSTLGDSFGFVNAEAMAMAKPVISTRIACIPDVVEHGRSGILIPPKDVDRLSDAICYLIEHPEDAERLGQRGRQIIEQRYDLERYITQHARLYEELYSQKQNYLNMHSINPKTQQSSKRIHSVRSIENLSKKTTPASRKQILIIQENGRHEHNRQFRECSALQRAFAELGVSSDIWGLGHDNFCQPFNDIVGQYDAVLSMENYDNGWHPDLSGLNVPKAFWCIDAHMGVERYLDFVRGHRFDVVFNSTEHFVDRFAGLAGASLWLPNAYDSFLVDKMFNVLKTVPLGFCGNVVNRGEWIEYLKQRWDLRHDEMVIGPDMVRAVNGYQIHWNLNASIDINYRTFETLGCRTLLVTNYTPGLEKLFTIGEHLVVYENQRDLDEKIGYYLQQPEEREKIASNGYRHVRQNHKYTHRAEEILQTLGFTVAEDTKNRRSIQIYDITNQMISKKKYLFLSGATKSGTTLLANALSLSKEISFLQNEKKKMKEGQWVQDVYEWGYGNTGLSKDYHMTESHPIATEENKIRLFRQWARFWNLAKPILAEKSPHNIIKTRFLQALFPSSKFIILIRNGIVQSTGEALQEERSPLVCCQEWVNAYQILIEDLPYLRDYLIVRYEDLTNETETTFDEIWSFIGVPQIDVKGRSFYVHSFRNGIKRSDFNKIRDMNRAHIENFMGKFDSETQTEMFRICRPIMEKFGYSTAISDYQKYLKTDDYLFITNEIPEIKQINSQDPSIQFGVNR